MAFVFGRNNKFKVQSFFFFFFVCLNHALLDCNMQMHRAWVLHFEEYVMEECELLRKMMTMKL